MGCKWWNSSVKEAKYPLWQSGQYRQPQHSYLEVKNRQGHVQATVTGRYWGRNKVSCLTNTADSPLITLLNLTVSLTHWHEFDQPKWRYTTVTSVSTKLCSPQSPLQGWQWKPLAREKWQPYFKKHSEASAPQYSAVQLCHLLDKNNIYRESKVLLSGQWDNVLCYYDLFQKVSLLNPQNLCWPKTAANTGIQSQNKLSE